MYSLVDELARGGLGIVMASSELPEILSLADRILVMADGRVTAEFAQRSDRRKAAQGGIAEGKDAESQVRMNRTRFIEHVARFQSLFALAALLLVAMSVFADSFLTIDNGLNVLRQISINVCLSIGMTMIILSGGIDLSVGSVSRTLRCRRGGAA